MRTALLVLPLLMVSSIASAQPRSAPGPIVVPPELTDPAMAARLGDMMQVMSKALLDLPVGEIQAAAEGREPTAAERNRKVRDVTDPVVLQRQMAQARPMIEQSMQAMARSLPAMARALSEVSVEMERAVENMPRPDYPRR